MTPCADLRSPAPARGLTKLRACVSISQDGEDGTVRFSSEKHADGRRSTGAGRRAQSQSDDTPCACTGHRTMPVASKPKAGRAQRLPVVDADEAFELAADAVLHRCSKSGHVNPSTEPPASSTTNDLELHVATECDSSTAEATNDCGSLVSDAAFRCRVSAVLVAIVCLSVLVLLSLRGNNVNEAGVPPATRAAAGAARSAPSPPASPPSSPQRTDLGSAQHLPPLPPSWRPSTPPPSQPPLMPQPAPLEPSPPPLIPPTLPPPLSPRAPAPSPSATALRLAAGNVLHGQVTIGSSGTVLTAREDNAEGAIWSMCEQSRRGAPAGWEVGCGQCGGLGYEFKGDFDWNAPTHSADVASPPDGLASPVVKRLLEVLQGDYSLRLYGARGRIPPNVRLIWLQLLDNQTLASLPHVCVCVAKPPLAPFYYPQAEIFNPLDAIWVHTHDYGGASQATQGRSGAGVPNSTAVPDHGWIEVTHCPDTWSPTWFFAAPVTDRARAQTLDLLD